MRMLECSWYSKEASQANIMAVLKRTHIFMNTATCLYVRPASEKENPVLRFPLPDKTDFLHADSRKIYDYHRKGGTDLPADYGMKADWEAKWVAKAMAGDTTLPTRAIIIHRASPFQGPASASSTSSVEQNHGRAQGQLRLNLQPDRHEPAQIPATPAQVKQEPGHSNIDFASKVRDLASQNAGRAIQIEDSPTVRKETSFHLARALSTSNVTINIPDSPEKATFPTALSFQDPADEELVQELEALMDAMDENEGEDGEGDERLEEGPSYMTMSDSPGKDSMDMDVQD